MHFTTSSSQETQNIGKQLASQLTGGDIVLLHGELGAGKTTFVKGLAEGLGITDDILSPTFTLMNLYRVTSYKLSPYGGSPEGRQVTNFVHIDTYRLKTEQELINIGVEDYLGVDDTICVIEWPEKIEKLLHNKKTLNVWLESAGESERKIKIEKLED